MSNTTNTNAAPARTASETPQNDYSGLLSDDQILDLGRLKLGLYRIEDMIAAVNGLAADSGFELREIPAYFPKLMLNDISRLVRRHELAEHTLKTGISS